MAENVDKLKHGADEAPVEELFLKRWSPRAFAETAVSEQDLRTVFSAARWAASSYNEQPWRILVGRKGDSTWQRIFDALVPANQSWAKAAPVLFATFAKKHFSHADAVNRAAAHDVGAATALICLQATALGLYTHGMGGYDAEKLRAAFHVPDEFDPAACWALGHLGDAATLTDQQREMEHAPRSRKPLAEILFSDWDKPAL